MRIIEPNVEILTPLDGQAILKHIETCGRTCYQSGDLANETSAEKFVAGIIKRGHESVLEHFSFTVRFTCDRGVSHEIVRHRIASYSQESTRYCNYSKDKFGNEITVIKPISQPSPREILAGFKTTKDVELDTIKYLDWQDACSWAEHKYFSLLKNGATPQEARSVLPNSLKTTLVMTTNLREWRHFFNLRCDEAAHPDMRYIALKLLALVHEQIPVVFDDLYEKFCN